jgi:hypothetical protein
MEETFKKRFPFVWTDPLELCGTFCRFLIEEARDLDQHRALIRELVGKYGAEWVWRNRSRLVAMLASLFTPSMN